jgi:hypothetical protein
LAEDLQKSLLQFFQHESIDEVETTSLFHDDLNMRNILIHDGELSAILDWECSSALPSWMSHSIPKFLYAPLRRYFDRQNYAEDAENEPGSHCQVIALSLSRHFCEIFSRPKWRDCSLDRMQRTSSLRSGLTSTRRLAYAMICSVTLRGTGWTRPGLANCFDSTTNVTTRDGERKKKVRHEDGPVAHEVEQALLLSRSEKSSPSQLSSSMIIIQHSGGSSSSR